MNVLLWVGSTPGSRQEKARKAIERSSQQGVWDERQQGRRKQQLQRVDKADCRKLIDAIESDRQQEWSHRSLPALVEQLQTPLRAR
jgi:hypothetical protein